MQVNSHPIVITLLVAGVLAAPSRAQWNEIERSQPFALEACASVNLQLERWDTAVRFLEEVTRREPEDAYAALWLTRALTELGRHAEGVTAGERAARFPDVHAQALLLIARNEAARGNSDAALLALEEAARSQLVDVQGALRKAAEFASLRKNERFRKVLTAMTPLPERIRVLSEAGDFDGLVALFRNCAVLVDPRSDGIADHVAAEVREHLPTRPRGGDPEQGERLRLIARAVDATLENGRMGAYVDARLGWSKEGIAAERKGWKVLKGLGSATRAHRFDQVVHDADAHALEASSRGDLLQLYHARVAASIAHLAVLDYRQPRRGVTQEDESRLGTEKILEALALARSLGSVPRIVECLDYLASHEVHRRAMTDAEFDRIICEATVLSSRLVPSARELGMWERMWRERRAAREER